MSFEEKNTWIYAVIAVVLPATYFTTTLWQLQHTAVGEIAYVGPMLTTIGAAVVIAIVGHIVVAIASPKDADKSDERDARINRFGEYVGSFVLWTGGLAALGLAMAEFEHFWIANAIFLAFNLSAITTSVVKIVAYRRGFSPW